MCTTIRIVLAMVREAFLSRAALHLENLALRQQLAALDRKGARPSLRMADRLFWVVLSRLWSGWREILVIVKPETVIGWHRKGFRRFWTRKSRRGKPGRPPVSSEFRGLIRRMSRENPLWGAPRIHGELRMLGFEVSEAACPSTCRAIQSHLRRHGGRSSRTTSGAWRRPTSSSYPPRRSVFYSCSLCCGTSVGGLFTSAPRHTRLRRGSRNRSGRPFRGRQHHGI